MEKEVVLSISLLASDRKETIRKCLDSLKPIMEKVKSELIIVDTGCGEEVRGILEEYTEKIIPFTWCKDFSKARNAGLEQAKGEWFLYIDDDEWFSDVTEIVNFFTSGEYKRFGMANYIQRNYLDKKKTEYSDSWVSRMVKLDKDTHFESSIHEYFTPIRGNVKLLHSAVEHFGYIFQSEKEKYEHSKRNVSLLLEMLEKEPDNIRWYTQLVQEYRGIREYKQLYELCKTALLRFEKIDVSEINKDRGCFYTGKLLVDMYTYDIEQAEKDFKESIADIRNTDCCRIALYYYGAEIAFLQKQYEKCETYSKNYLELYEKVKDDEVRQMLEGAFCVRDMLEERALNSIYSFIIECGLKKTALRI